MTAPLTHTDAIVLDYLAALWAHGEDLAPELRDELMATVADYIAVRRLSIDDPAEIVRRLGPPESLVAAVRRGQLPPHVRLPALVAPPAAAPVVRSAAGGVEYTAIGLLTVGAFVLPGVSPVTGMLLATGSPHWTPAQKAVGWSLTVGSGAAGLLFALFLAASGFATSAAVLLIYLIVTGGAVAAGVRLLTDLRGRPS